ncbi:MAG TPA: histidinol dehydrogenase, partial [Stellaceae bacterium]
MPVRLSTGDPGFEAEFRQLLTAKRESAADVDAVVAQIIEDVVARGDAALIDYTRRFDGVDLAAGGLRLTAREIADVAAAAAPETVAALRVAAERIESFHRRQLPAPIDYVDELGVRLAARWRPVAAAGLYVPGGTAAYPSSVLMNAIPAKVAGVERLVMTVPTPGGVLNPLVLAAAQMLGIDEIYRVGGAQAIAALAYGTAMIAPVDKIVGPGNAYVAAAKRRVFGRVGIDMIAGPSEILVVADRHNDPEWIAADLLSQAEHDRAA